MKSAPFLIMIGILLLASAVRLYGSRDYFPFREDQVDDLLTIRAMWQDITGGQWGNLPLRGQPGVYRFSLLNAGERNPIYHGAAYYYLLLPAAALARFDPYGVVLFLTAIGIISVWLLYKAAGPVGAFFGATSYWLAAYSRWIWAGSILMVFFGSLALIAYVNVLAKKTRWWYLLAAALSLGSQVHDSGYVPVVLYGALLLIARPPMPKGWRKKLLLALIFIVPLLPTLVTETTGEFRMSAAFIQLVVGALREPGALAGGIRFFVNDWLGIPMGIVFLYGVWRLRRSTFLWWWILFLPVPMIIQFLYSGAPNVEARTNTTLFAAPLVFFTLSEGLVSLWCTRRIAVRALCVAFAGAYLVLNVRAMNARLWRYSDFAWGYTELTTIAERIDKTVAGQPYNLTIYRQHWNGSYVTTNVYELIYILDIKGLPMPETFNGQPAWGMPWAPIPLKNRPARETIIVIDRNYLTQTALPDGSVLIGQTPSYQVYKTL